MNKTFHFDVKNFSNRYLYICLIVLIIFSTILTQIGVSKFKTIKKNEKEFLRAENTFVQRYFNYRVYGIYGFRVLFSPSPLSVLFYRSSPFKELEAFIDNGIRLDSQKPESPELIFEASGGILDFSNFLYLIMNLLSLFFGFHTFKDIKYINFIISVKGYFKSYISLILSKLFFILLFLLSFFIINLIVLKINHIDIKSIEIINMFILLITTFLMNIFSFSIGLLGAIPYKKKLVFCLLIWFFFMFVSPEIISIFAENSIMSNRYSTDIKKVTVLMKFEREAYKRSQRLNSTEEKNKSDKEMAYRYQDNEKKIIQSIDNNIINATESKIKNFQRLSSLFSPMTFYKSVSGEISSRGYKNYIEFKKSNKNMQGEFNKWYIEKVFQNPYQIVIPFLKNGENLFHAESTLPHYFILGVLSSLAFIIVFFITAFLSLKRKIPYQHNKQIKISLKRGGINYFLTRDKFIKKNIIALFKNNLKEFVTVDGFSCNNLDFIYLSSHILNKKDIKSFQKFLELPDEFTKYPLWLLMLKYAIDSNKIIIGDSFLYNRSDDEILKIQKIISESNSIFLEIGIDKEQYNLAKNQLLLNSDKTVDAKDYSNLFKNKTNKSIEIIKN